MVEKNAAGGYDDSNCKLLQTTKIAIGTEQEARSGMDLQKRVILAVKQIPRGRVATYGQIALLCGQLHGARQVGRTLSRCGDPEVPAHRVVNARGWLSGAHAFAAPDLQRRLLEAEGVVVDENNYVNLRLFGWTYTAADQAALQALFTQAGI